MSEGKLFLGLDVGSVSVGLAVLDENRRVITHRYVRHKGQPVGAAAAMLRELTEQVGRERIEFIAVTGTAGRLVGEPLDATVVNEVIAQALATRHLHPDVRTVIEIGGEDSKLIFLADPENGSAGLVADFAMNTICAAGTGSFLDQQATRLGLSIEEFGQLALESESPPRVAGRCSVFAKSDMIHLQQKGTPTKDIVAGLCFALARNFKSTVGAARVFRKPIGFQGGVAANPGIIRALESVLDLEPGELVVPELFGVTGAIGATLQAMQETSVRPRWAGLEELEARASAGEHGDNRLKPLRIEKSRILRTDEVCRPEVRAGERIPAYLGVDIGSISTNVVVIDAEGRVLSKRYLMTAGQPIEAVRQGLREVGDEIGQLVEIKGACTTGSGRYLIADLIGADVVRNEITAQARGAVAIDPEVDTIFEIGGQDSKYISLDNGAIVDFEMNKVCAAGTGSFLEEQAEKLGISIKGEFGELALKAQSPINLGERCTVFMETELVKHQQAGADKGDLVAGLSYSIVYNYLNRVVQGRPVRDRIFFQGGTAANQGVVAAFEMVTGKPITVPPHHEVTGAIGCAMIAREEHPDGPSRFKGFDTMSALSYDIRSFECHDCPNRCEINRVTVEGEKPLFYGSRCEKFDVDRKSRRGDHLPDLFEERSELLLASHSSSGAVRPGAPRVGVPRSLLFHDLYPLWHAVLAELGCEIVLSEPTNKKIIHAGAEQSVAETCFPVKVALGHVLDLLEKDIDFIFLPSIVNLPKHDPRATDSFVCPYVQSFCYTVKSAAPIEARGVKILQPVWYLQIGERQVLPEIEKMARVLGARPGDAKRALAAGEAALARFQQACKRRGKEVLDGIAAGERAIAVVSRSYNGCDLGANLEIPRKLRNMGILPIPMDFLPLDEVELPEEWQNMYWRYGQRILCAAEIVASDDRLFPLYITNFGCGPDSFIHKFFRERLGGKPCLMIEVDEHSADAGMITRCEAFLESIRNSDGRVGQGRRFIPVNIRRGEKRTVLVPNMSPHAFALAAAMTAAGMPAQVLPEPDEETLYWGRQFTTGKECFPCIVTTGDMVKFTQRPDFDRDRYAFFMGGSGGPCRFGQYNALQRMVLDQLGYTDVPIFAPNQASSFYNDMGIVGGQFLRDAWRGIVAADVLQKALRETRPYEVNAGETDRVHSECLADLCETIEQRGDLVASMQRARQRFDTIAKRRDESRPVIGLVGEFYVRESAFSNQDVVAKIEALGGEVWSAPVYEWFLYRNWRRGMRAALARDRKLWLKNKAKDYVQKRDEHALVEPFAGYLRNAHEPRTEAVLDLAAPYVHSSFEGEAILTVGKALDFVAKGLSGIVSAMPFTCLPGTVSHAIMKRCREENDGFPFLNMVYDGFEQATSATRLEAFMHQAKEYHRAKMAAV